VNAGGSAASSAAGRYRSVLSNRQYLIFLASSSAATVGYGVYAISIVWLTYSLTHRLLDVGFVIAIEYACYTLTFLTGPFVDRVRNQRAIFVASYPIQAAAAAAIGLGVLFGFLSVDVLFVLVAVISMLWDMTWAAANAAPAVLLTPDEQFAAAGVSGAIGGSVNIAGYAVGGVLILLVGAEGGMLLYAALLTAGAVLALPLRISPRRTIEESFAESFRSGWDHVAGGDGHPYLQLAVVDSIYGFLVGASALLITLLAATSYHTSATGYSVLFVAFIVGGVVAGLALGQWNPRGTVGIVLAIGLVACGAAFLLAVALPPSLVLGAVAWLLVGFAGSAYVDAKYAFYRGSISSEKLGRFVSNMYLFPGMASVAGAVFLSWIASFGRPLALGEIAGGLLVAAGLLALALPRVRGFRY
jgi:hypothetical protein